MDIFEFPTFLSEPVKFMVVDIGVNYYHKRCDSINFITSNCTLKWKLINEALCIPEKINVLDQSSEWFMEVIHKSWSVYVEAHSVILNSCFKPDDVQDLLEWTSEPKAVKEYLFSFVNSSVSTVEVILFLTAVIERSLGNLFLLEGVNVPSLLRDLLITPEIKAILGNTPVVFLQILLGTPLALNLRNLVWHGFPSPDELYPHFASTLFVIIFSVGELLKLKKVDINTIPIRSQTKYSQFLFSNIFPNIGDDSGKTLKLLFQHDVIPRSHKNIWKQALEYYVEHKYGPSLMILLPQFEHMLRCVFCKVNNCSQRCLTAESMTLYTTMNEILGKYFVDNNGEEKENKLLELFGNSIMEILLDLFVYPEGPRVRDKISHGECFINDIPEMLVNHILCLSVIIVIKCKHIFARTVADESENKQFDNAGEIFLLFQKYEVKFHPIAFVKVCIKRSLTSLNAWSERLYERCHSLLDPQCQFCELSVLLESILCKIKNDRFTNSECVLKYLSSFQILTVYRPKAENEIVRVLKYIMENIEQITEQVKDNLDVMHYQCVTHLMRSRNRNTYKRYLNDINELPAGEIEKLSKFCRVVLQYVQNVCTWTKHDKNRWLEIQGITVKLANYILSIQPNFVFLK